MLADDTLKAIETFAHVAGLDGEVDLEAACETEHDRARLSLESF